MEQAEFNKVRQAVREQCGSKVVIRLDRGRNKVDIEHGVIQNAYPSVFTPEGGCPPGVFLSEARAIEVTGFARRVPRRQRSLSHPALIFGHTRTKTFSRDEKEF